MGTLLLIAGRGGLGLGWRILQGEAESGSEFRSAGTENSVGKKQKHRN